MGITNLRNTEIHQFLVTDIFDEISLPKKYYGISHYMLVKWWKSYSNALEAGEVEDLLTTQEKQNLLVGKIPCWII